MTRSFRGALLVAAFSIQPAGADPSPPAAPGSPGGITSVSAAWTYAAMGEMGESNIVIARVGHHREILAGTRYSFFSFWYALRYSSARNDYEQVFVSDPLPAPVLWMGVRELTGDRDEDLVVGLESGEVRLHDLESKRLVSSFATIPDAMGMTIGDLDGDGVAEVLVSSYGFPGDLHVFSGGGAPLWQVPGAGGWGLRVGQMDDDPGLEVACSDGQIVDVATQTVQWDRPEGFGYRLTAGDIDGDGRDELVAAETGLAVRAFDVELQTLKFTIPTSQDIAEVALADTDCDGLLEIVVGDGQGGLIQSFEAATQTVKWQLGANNGAAYFAIGDADGDGQDELVWASGAGTSAQDWLSVHDVRTLAPEWLSVDLRGPFLGPALGDVDGDGEPEIVVASSLSNEGYTGGQIVVFDARTLRMRAISDSVEGGFGPLRDLKLRNVDSDPELEILVTSEDLYDGVVDIFDYDGAANTFSLNWRNSVAAYGSPFYSVEAADVDLDGQLEIVAGGSRVHSGTPGIYIYVYDYATGGLEWSSEHLGDAWLPIRDLIVESSGGGNPDILAIADGGPLFVFDGVTKQALPPTPGTFSVLRHNPFAASRSVFLGDTVGNVYRYDRGPSTYALAATYALGGTAQIDGVHPLSAAGALVGSGGRLSLYDDLASPPLWTSPDYGWSFGRYVCRGVGAHARWLSGGFFGVEEVGPAAILSSVSPTSASPAGGAVITATGSGFQPGAEVFVGSAAATNVVWQSPTEIQASTPPGAAGSLTSVLVSNPDASFASLEAVLFLDFLDVDAADPFHAFVETVFRRGVSAGCGAGAYCPNRPLTRAQASIFLVRSMFPKGFLAPKASGSVFADVDCGGFGSDETELIARLGITSGCGNGYFCPDSALTRAQTAVFLLRAVEGADYVPPPAQGIFADVPAADPFAPWIEELGARGITAGCGGGNYCPGAATTRSQMAAFVSRSFFVP